MRVALDDHWGELCVEDDGRGFAAEEAMRSRSNGHLGLRMLADLARDAGGRLQIDSRPGGGTRVRLQAPLT